jgi:hypothetical protein
MEHKPMSRTLLVTLTALILLAACTDMPPPQDQGDAAPTESAPSVTPMPVAPLSIEDTGYVQDGDAVAYGFTVHNPNRDLLVEESDYRVVAYADDGTVLGSDRGRIARIAPEAIWGVGGQIRLAASTSVARLGVVVDDGDAVSPFPAPEFVAEDVAIFRTPDDPQVRATAKVRNPYRLGVLNVPIGVLFFNEDGELLAGAATYVGYIPGEGQGGVSVSTEVSGVARAHVYPAMGAITRFHDPETWPAGAATPELLRQGFAQEGGTLIWAAEVRNPGDRHVVRRWQLALTAYDTEDRVLATRMAPQLWLLEGQQLGVTERLPLPEGQRADRVTAEIVPQDFVPVRDVEDVPRFGVEDVTLEPDELFPKVHGRIVNPADRDRVDIKVVALLYDAAGAIVGAGTSYVDFIPAEGKAAVSVYVAGDAARAARATLSATVTSRSD